ncbi:hypothetical protein Nepgr_019850 [Nepenthes gracilis]|uniref:DNA-directed RNA polymerase subunit n=1 Tax=Nepenthes gracilis TaxID=150966 RepID=A0AAD3SVX4_NEPGR|nr:hypothetical protein Nepgr_019850 [Nepenthes gracilis]
MDGFRASEVNLVVYIQPSKTKVVSEAITRELSSLLFKYNENFDGVLLAYEVVEIMSKRAKILSGLFPYLGVRLKSNLLLFSPKPDMCLEGKVVKLARESIHVVVLGFSAAIITEEDIREEFKLKIKHGEEVLRSRFHKRHVIKAGSIVRFLVKSFDEEILHISGSLGPSYTGSVRWLDKNSKEDHVAIRSAEKRKERDGQTDLEGHISGLVEGERIVVCTVLLIVPHKKSLLNHVRELTSAGIWYPCGFVWKNFSSDCHIPVSFMTTTHSDLT